MKWKKVLIAVAILDSVLLLGAIGFYFSTDIPSASSKYVAEREKAVKRNGKKEGGRKMRIGVIGEEFTVSAKARHRKKHR